MIYGTWDASTQTFAMSTLARLGTLRDGESAPYEGWPLPEFVLKFDAAKKSMVGRTKGCSYAEFVPKGSEVQ